MPRHDKISNRRPTITVNPTKTITVNPTKTIKEMIENTYYVIPLYHSEKGYIEYLGYGKPTMWQGMIPRSKYFINITLIPIRDIIPKYKIPSIYVFNHFSTAFPKKFPGFRQLTLKEFLALGEQHPYLLTGKEEAEIISLNLRKVTTVFFKPDGEECWRITNLHAPRLQHSIHYEKILFHLWWFAMNKPNPRILTKKDEWIKADINPPTEKVYVAVTEK
jgi:hypothetical protein